METTKLEAEVRALRGKGPARRLRSEGKLPAVFYGPEVDPTPLTVDPKALEEALRGPRGRNTLFEVTFGSDSHLAMVRDLDVEPVSRALIHADLLKVTTETPIKVEIPFKTKGRAAGVVAGGKLNVTRRTVPVRTTPGNIPTEIVVDVTALEMFQTISVKDLVLPEGVEAALAPELTLAIVLEDRKAQKEAAEAAAAEAAAAAPAAAPES
ncbi:MAG: 50S ribosomal protein L25 [Deltaproteobacteria bacterium]|nr:50S ribosomal protein L25 [Deltaproteobacteria bacterium]